MLGNFRFMRSGYCAQDYAGFADDCDKAEDLYAQHDYRASIIYSRMAIEKIVRWVYGYPYFDMPAWIGSETADRVSHELRLNSPQFKEWLNDYDLLNRLNEARIDGNSAVHTGWRPDASAALFCLHTLFDLIQTVEACAQEHPYSAEFYEPIYDADIDYDYEAMIEQARNDGDISAEAKCALLLKAQRPEYDVRHYLELLPQEEPVRALILVLEEPEALRALLGKSTIRLSALVRKCYEECGFNWRETETVACLAAGACRALAVSDGTQLNAYIERIQTEVSHG